SSRRSLRPRTRRSAQSVHEARASGSAGQASGTCGRVATDCMMEDRSRRSHRLPVRHARSGLAASYHHLPHMDFFNYENGELHCEDVPAAALAEAYGTPLYVYSQATLLHHYRQIAEAFAELSPTICYSIKSNGNLH